MDHPAPGLTIGALAAQAGVNVETIRFYQRQGLMHLPKRPYGTIRRYGTQDLARLRFIRSAQRLGFSLGEIAELLRLEDGTQCGEARTLAARKLEDVRERLADLRRMEAALSGLVSRCATGEGRVRCPLIEALRQA